MLDLMHMIPVEDEEGCLVCCCNVWRQVPCPDAQIVTFWETFCAEFFYRSGNVLGHLHQLPFSLVVSKQVFDLLRIAKEIMSVMQYFVSHVVGDTLFSGVDHSFEQFLTGLLQQ